jgi:hypothetical protein
MELRQRQNKILFVVDGHIHVDDAKNREDSVIEDTNSAYGFEEKTKSYPSL